MAWPEWAVRAWEPVAPHAEKMAIWQGYEDQLQTLLIFAIGIALYTTFVFAFYQNISKRNAWRSKRKRGFGGWLTSVFQNWFVFPGMSFVYFTFLASALFLLAKSQGTEKILLIAMSLVVGIRVVAYASEAAAVDLAKLLPLGLLGVMIVDPGNVNRDLVWARFMEVPSQVPLLGRYLVLFLVLETTLKAGRSIYDRTGARKALQRASKPLKRGQLAQHPTIPTHDEQGMPMRGVPVKPGSSARPPAKATVKAKEGPGASDFGEVK